MDKLNELASALCSFQGEIVKVGKSATNPFYSSSYAPLDKIMIEALPIMTKYGLSITQFPSNIDGESALTTMLLHSSGQSLESTIPLLVEVRDKDGNSKVTPQTQGSAITYARRYGFAAVLGIVIEEDDDGNTASAGVASSAPTRTASPNHEASIKQKNYILKLWSESAPDDDFLTWFKNEYKTDKMNSEQASEVISRLKEGKI